MPVLIGIGIVFLTLRKIGSYVPSRQPSLLKTFSPRFTIKFGVKVFYKDLYVVLKENLFYGPAALCLSMTLGPLRFFLWLGPLVTSRRKALLPS